MDEGTLANMRARVAQCRRLADSITDARAAGILRQMADEGDGDIARAEAEQPPAEVVEEDHDDVRSAGAQNGPRNS